MIGLRRNKRGDMVLTIDSYIDVDSTPDIQSSYFDCIYINTKTDRAFQAILLGASPILSYKCSYKPIFANTAMKGKEQVFDYIIDGYVSDMSNEKVYEIIDRIKAARQKYEIKDEMARPTNPYQLFANINKYHLSRDKRTLEHKLIEKSSLGYINPIMEHYHSLGLFHLSDLFMWKDSMLEAGVLQVKKFIMKEHLCPKCNHSHLLYTECCPQCGSSNLSIQNIIHHFSCANVSAEETYNVGGVMVCPKCHKKLRHIGVDYDRPAVVYSCNDCENTFTVPRTMATCCYCESTVPVNTLVMRDVVDYEITNEGIRELSNGGTVFSNLVNMYDNFSEYPMFVNRLRRLLLDTYRDEHVSILVGKIWILNENKETVKMKDKLLGTLCNAFSNHKVSYNNNIFYVTHSSFDNDDFDQALRRFQKEQSRAIRKIADMIQPEQVVCCICDTKTKQFEGHYDDFFSQLNFVDITPDDYVAYTPVKVEGENLADEEEKPVQLDMELEDENDRLIRRVKLYKTIVSIMVFIAAILAAGAVFMWVYLD